MCDAKDTKFNYTLNVNVCITMNESGVLVLKLSNKWNGCMLWSVPVPECTTRLQGGCGGLLTERLRYLLDGLQHGPAPVPRLGGLPDAVEAGHTVPLPVLQFPVEGVGQHQNTVIQVEVGHLLVGKK